MAVAFDQGQELTRGDLDIYLTNPSGNPLNVYGITYGIYFVDPATSAEVLIGSPTRVPVNPSVGEYYAALQIPPNATAGSYRIRWAIVETAGAETTLVVQEFTVVSIAGTVSTSPYSVQEQELISKLRYLLRDRNPDRNYRFRPPEGEGQVGCYNQVFGHIWEDEELLQFLQIALWKWNMQPPETDDLSNISTLAMRKPSWQAALLWGALVNAAQALAYSWTADEFSYSIGGISLDIEKSSKYMDLKRNAEEQWDKLTEAKRLTTKFFSGLSQPRFGRGVRSAFGGATGRGVLSPRSFM